MQPRKLSEGECRFVIGIVPDGEPSQEDFSDPRDVADILARLERDEREAWCFMTVTAHWGGFQGQATLGGCSFPSDQPYGVYADDAGLVQEALAELNASIALAARNIATLIDPPMRPIDWAAQPKHMLRKVRRG